MTARRWIALLAAVILLAGCGRVAPATPEALSTAKAGAVTQPAAQTPEQAGEQLPADAAETLVSLAQVDDYPLFSMRYHGPYAPRLAFLREGSHPADAAASAGWACSLFAVLGNPDERLYGRNFDWEFSPALLLFTEPVDGYASASIVDIAYLGFGGERAQILTSLPPAELGALLQAPWLPFDGMNEAGLAVGMAAVPEADVDPDPAKQSIGSLGVIREMLDHAGSVEEAIAILERYNIDFAGGPPLHYLIADRSGHAALVEFYAGEVQIFPNDAPWLQATNFSLAEAGEDTAGRCWRYDTMGRELESALGKMTADRALRLLASVSQPHTQWSVVYGMSSATVQVVMGRRYEAVHSFALLPAAEGPP